MGFFKFIRSRGGWIECAGRVIGHFLIPLGVRYRLFRGETDVEFHEVPIEIPALPGELEGLRVAQLSDVHHSGYTSLKDLERLVEGVNSHRPDLVLLTGDYVSEHGRYFKPCVCVLRGLEAPLGVYAVLGNHDYYEGVENALEAFQGEHPRLLVNSHVLLRRGNATLALVGLDDYYYGECDLEAAMKDVPPEVPVLLLVHHPDSLEHVPAGTVSFAFAGHTHGGQMVLPLLGAPRVPSRHGRRYLAGMVRRPNVHAYVSRGIGTAVLPFRHRCRPEVPIFRLVCNGAGRPQGETV